MSIVGTAQKLPGETIARVINFSNELLSGESLSSITSIICINQDGDDVSADVIVSGFFIQPGTANVQFQMQDGDEGDSDTVTVTVLTSLNNTYQASIALLIGYGIDLTSLCAVKSWAGIQSSSNDSDIASAITAFSAYVLRLTGRGPSDGSVPTSSPFLSPLEYDEFYDGSGTLRQPIRNWPITSVSAVIVNGQTLPQSTSVNVWGWVVDGDGKFISIRGGYNPSVATFQNYRYQGGRGGYAVNQGPGFTEGVQNVEVQYTAGFNGVPQDLQFAATRTVGLEVKRRAWIGQRSQAMAQGAGSIFYNTWEMEPRDYRTVMYYQRRAA